MTREDIDDMYPLTPMQQGMLFHGLRNPDAHEYLEQSVWTFVGPLDVGALKRAWECVVSRHAALRTAVLWEGLDVPLQVVYPSVEVPFQILDWTTDPHPASADRLLEFLKADLKEGFTLGTAPLMRITTIREREDRHHCIWTHHHLLLDGWSVSILLQDLSRHYEAFVGGTSPLLPPAPRYREYISWLQKRDVARARDFWQKTLEGFDGPNLIPFPRPGTDLREGEAYCRYQCSLDRESTRLLSGFARDNGLTLNTLMQGAWGLLLSRYSGSRDIVFGATVSGRPAELFGAEHMVGLFINTVPVRMQLGGGRSVVEWLSAHQSHMADADQYSYASLADIQQWLGTPHAGPLFNSLLVVENFPVRDVMKGAIRGVRIESGPSFTRTNYPLTIALSPGEEIGIEIAYDTGLLDGEAVAGIGVHLRNTLTNLVRHSSRPTSRLSLADESECHRVVMHWNETAQPHSETLTLPGLLSRLAGEQPGSTAVEDELGAVLFEEFERRSNKLAHLLQRRGMGKETIVGLLLNRSADAVIAMVAVLKAGGAFLPLDPLQPQSRLRMILEDSGATILITSEDLLPLCEGWHGTLLPLECVRRQIDEQSEASLAVAPDPQQLAYVVYTSGSTGTPKGVAVQHRSLLNHALSMREFLGVIPRDRVMHFLSPSFDAALEEIFPTLAAGAAVVIHPRPNRAAPSDLHRFITERRISLVHLPTGYWHQYADWLRSAGEEAPGSLRLLVVGGESPSPEALARWTLATGGKTRFVNAYGPTEATVAATAWTNDASTPAAGPWITRIPVGRPLSNVRVYVLDCELQPLPPGFVGEIFIGGMGVARGYLHRTMQTASTFLPDPYTTEAGSRMYRTGDLGRYLNDGTVEFIGRRDNQVKVRGFRIELGEIENRLREHASVAEAAVIVREDNPGDRRLVAYVVFHEQRTATPADLQGFLQNLLPDYMVPTAFVGVPALPHTATGKVDKKALPEPTAGALSQSRKYIAPRTTTEELLATIWERVLNLPQVGSGDDFFALGGHSLLATQLLSRIRDTFSVELPMSLIFESRNLSDLAVKIDGFIRTGEGSAAQTLCRADRSQPLPLSYSQQRLWFLDQLQPGGGVYTIPAAFRLKGRLDLESLEQGLTEVIRRHEILRTRFAAQGGVAHQVIAAPAPVTMSVVEMESEGGQELLERSLRLAEEDASRPFDLEHGPLFRVRLYRIGAEDHLLAFVMHHSIADGWSLGILIRELCTLYHAFKGGEQSPLEELRYQYADYAAWQQQVLSGQALHELMTYWTRQLDGAPALLEMPMDFPRPATPLFSGATEYLTIPPPAAQLVRDVSRQEGVTLFMTLLTGFQVLLHRYTGQLDIVVGSPVAGRTHTALEDLIGFFVNSLPFRTTFEPSDTFATLVRKVRDTALQAYAHQDLPFEKIVEELHPVRDLSHAPLFQVMFVLQNAPVSEIALTDLTVVPVPMQTQTSSYDLALELQESDEGIRVSCTYCTELFRPETVRRLLSHYCSLLRILAENPDVPVNVLDFLSDEERKRQLVEWNATEAPFPAEETVHRGIESLALQHPDDPAVVLVTPASAEGRPESLLTYDELNGSANQIAHYLRRRGVGPGDLVGVCMERTPVMITTIVGCLKAGAAFVPLDPTYPDDRLRYMIAESRLSLLATQRVLLDHFLNWETPTVPIDADWIGVDAESRANPDLRVPAESPAYVIFTSGSTGRPKGTVLAHRGLRNLALAQRSAFAINRESRILQFSSLSFDASIWEIVMALLNGASLWLTTRETIADAGKLATLLKRQGITTITLPPSVLAAFTEHDLPALRTLITAGEKCTPDLVARWSRGRRFVNAYGPTETTVCASMYQSEGPIDQPPPIGKPIKNFQLYIVDGAGALVPQGVPGELWIGGVGLAHGYLHRPELTAEKFVPNPFGQPGSRLYRSGDLCRYLPDGNIDFLGRIDHQVKIRGFRIEPGEIEAVLSRSPAVSEAVVIARAHPAGDTRLVAYVVMKPGASAEPEALRSHVRTFLPEYMVPSVFVQLEAMPLTLNNKIDRHALPEPEQRSMLPEFVAPRTETEIALAGLAADLLQVDRVGVSDSFFDLGGHSLLATQFVSRIRDRFGVDITLRSVFELPSIAEVALEIDRLRTTPAGEDTRIQPVSRERVRTTLAELNR